MDPLQTISLEEQRERWRLVLDALRRVHDVPERPDRDDVLAVLVQTILSQSTTQSNAARAFDDLLETFQGDWVRVAEADVERVVQAIRHGGLARQKAPRLQRAIRQAMASFGSATLEALHDESDESAAAFLGALPGVGPKTVAFVMMWAMGRDVFPMDTHIFRILRRLGWLDETASDAVAHRTMEATVPRGQRFDAHMLLVEHGRTVCHARSPICATCVLNSFCQEYQDAHQN